MAKLNARIGESTPKINLFLRENSKKQISLRKSVEIWVGESWVDTVGSYEEGTVEYRSQPKKSRVIIGDARTVKGQWSRAGSRKAPFSVSRSVWRSAGATESMQCRQSVSSSALASTATLGLAFVGRVRESCWNCWRPFITSCLSRHFTANLKIFVYWVASTSNGINCAQHFVTDKLEFRFSFKQLP